MGGLGDCAGDDAKCLGPDGFQLLKFAVCTALFTSGDMEEFCELGFLSCIGGFLWSLIVSTFVHVSCGEIEALGCRMALHGFGMAGWLHVGQLHPFPRDLVQVIMGVFPFWGGERMGGANRGAGEPKAKEGLAVTT